MSHLEDPYISFDKSEIWQELKDTELWKWVNSLEEGERPKVRDTIVEAIAKSLERAKDLPANQAGQTEDLAGKYNFILHKFCWGGLKLTYSVITEILKAKVGASNMGPKEAATLSKAAWDVYSSIETPDTDEWAIIEAVEIFNFRLGSHILKAPGPTIAEIEKELANKSLFYDDLPTRLVEMENRKILRKETIDAKTYYQIRYVSELITGGP